MAVSRVCLPPRASRGCTAVLGGASSSLVWRARGVSSSPVRWPRTFKVRKKSFLAMSTDIAPTSSMLNGLALKFEEDLVFKCP